MSPLFTPCEIIGIEIVYNPNIAILKNKFKGRNIKEIKITKIGNNIQNFKDNDRDILKKKQPFESRV